MITIIKIMIIAFNPTIVRSNILSYPKSHYRVFFLGRFEKNLYIYFKDYFIYASYLVSYFVQSYIQVHFVCLFMMFALSQPVLGTNSDYQGCYF